MKDGDRKKYADGLKGSSFHCAHRRYDYLEDEVSVDEVKHVYEEFKRIFELGYSI